METELMREEWVAWRKLCDLLKAKGLDVNIEIETHDLIIAWGDALVALRKVIP